MFFAHDQRRLKRLECELSASRSDIERVAKSAAKKTFFCRADAAAGAAEMQAQTTAFHQLNVRVQERPRYGRGLPKKNVTKTPDAIEYVLSTEVIEKHAALAKRRQAASSC